MNITDLQWGQRVLVTVGKNDQPRGTQLRAISPNGLYVHLYSDRSDECVIGWVAVTDVVVLDVWPGLRIQRSYEEQKQAQTA
jgi:hypothetical protein